MSAGDQRMRRQSRAVGLLELVGRGARIDVAGAGGGGLAHAGPAEAVGAGEEERLAGRAVGRGRARLDARLGEVVGVPDSVSTRPCFVQGPAAAGAVARRCASHRPAR